MCACHHSTHIGVILKFPKIFAGKSHPFRLWLSIVLQLLHDLFEKGLRMIGNNGQHVYLSWKGKIGLSGIDNDWNIAEYIFVTGCSWGAVIGVVHTRTWFNFRSVFKITARLYQIESLLWVASLVYLWILRLTAYRLIDLRMINYSVTNRFFSTKLGQKLRQNFCSLAFRDNLPIRRPIWSGRPITKFIAY